MTDKPEDHKPDLQTEVEEVPPVEPIVTEQVDHLALVQAKADENWERLLRAQAELDNVQRRAEREIANAHKFALEKFAKELLLVVDSLEMALQTCSAEHHDNTMFAGIELTYKMLLDTLQKQSIKQLNPLGEMFNPQQHEAVATVPHVEVEPNTIMVVMQKGYTLYDRLIRPALVTVSTK